MFNFKLSILLIEVSFLYGSPIPGPEPPSALSNEVDLFKFFRDFGYLPAPPSDSETLYTEDAVSNALKQVQKFGGLNETGRFDNETQRLLATPRCGNPDLVQPESTDQQRRRKRYIIGSRGWKSRRLTYRLNNWSYKLPSKEYVEDSLNRAFTAWSRYSGLHFQRVEQYSEADIEISFGRYIHGDRYPFDGPGYTLAHAYYPYTYGALGGDIHFDEDENWGLGQHNLDLFTVAIHEIGHSLGLSHSPDRDSVMFAYYKGESPALGYDDILAVYNLYIKNGPPDFPIQRGIPENPPVTTEASSTSSSTTPTTPINEDDPYKRDIDGSENPVNAICNGGFDSIAVLRGEIFAFKGKSVWRYRRPGDLFPGFPLPFSRMFPGVPGSLRRIDAAYEKLDGHIVFFSGEEMYEYDGTHWTKESHLSTLGLPQTIKSIDAAFIWAKNDRTYIFKGEEYWRLDDKRVEKGYPRLIVDHWAGSPPTVDSVIVWKKDTFAFNGGFVWRFDDDPLGVSSGYPLRDSSLWFSHCTASS